MDNETINNIIIYLNTKNYYEKFAWLQLYGNNGKRVDGLSVIIIELKRLKLIEENIDKDGKTQYLLNLKTRNALKALPRAYENKPYEYFFDEDKKETDSENTDKWYNRENAKKRFDDYPKERNQKIFFIWAAVIELILLLLALWKSK